MKNESIPPVDGYYILDGNTSNNTIFQKSMKYLKYLSDIEKIISTHPAEKYCELTLDESDSFANYTYKCEKENLIGDVKLKQGAKLTLEYEITDDSHKLKSTSGEVVGINIGKSDKKIKKSIVIIAEYDGRTITKEDFGIEITEGE